MADSFKQKINDYVNYCFTINNDRSQEYYFGENNSLKTRLINWFTNTRELLNDAAKNNPDFLPKDGLLICQQETDKFTKIIKEEFNIEGCTLGFTNTVNACCYCHLGNSDLFGDGKESKNVRLRLNDIIDTKNGFKYKNKKGIHYVVVMGYPIIANGIFTSGEAAAIMVHEFGHAMQHIVNSFNVTTCNQIYETMYRAFDNIDKYDLETQKYIKRMFKRLRKALANNDTKQMDIIANEYLNESNKSDGVSFSSITNDQLQGMVNSSDNNDWFLDKSKYLEKMREQRTQKNKSFSNKLKNFFRGLGGAISGIMIIPCILAMNKRNKNKELNDFKVFEETADNFCQIYGLGVEASSFFKKAAMLNDSTANNSVMARIPLFDLFWSLDNIKDDFSSTLAGYPTDKNRMLNMYRSAMFELQNNKDLSQSAKEEIKKQIEQYKSFYDDFVAIDSKKGWLYRLISGLNHTSLEKEAAKDTYVNQHVLIPLQKRMDKNFNPEKEYEDNDDNLK